MMKCWFQFVVFTALIVFCSAAPLKFKKASKPKKVLKDPVDLAFPNEVHDYYEYLAKVMSLLSVNKDVKEKVEMAIHNNDSDAAVAEINKLGDHARNKLDHIKYLEIQRLNTLESELRRRHLEENGVKVGASVITPQLEKQFVAILRPHLSHVDHSSPRRFTDNDLKFMIEKLHKDLATLDNIKDIKFKEHEMKEALKMNKTLNAIKDPAEREKKRQEIIASIKERNKHQFINAPGHKAQVEGVWRNEDHIDSKFEPKAFFAMHDTNSDGYLDISEVESLLLKTVNDSLSTKGHEADPETKEHELERMRQKMFREMDRDNDYRISKKEFLEYSDTPDFESNPEWKTEADAEKQPFTDDELRKYSLEHDDDESEDEEPEDDESSANKNEKVSSTDNQKGQASSNSQGSEYLKKKS